MSSQRDTLDHTVIIISLFKAAEQNFNASCTSSYHVLCIKFHQNPLHNLGEVALLRSDVNVIAAKMFKLNYLPLKGTEQKFTALCTSAYRVLSLCNVSSKSIALFRIRFADKVPYPI